MDNIIQEAIEVVKNNGVILYPTETVLGLGCDANSRVGIEKIYNIKNRPKNKSFIVLFENIEHLKQFKPDLSSLEIAYLNAERPTTVVLSNVLKLPKELLANDGSLGVRLSKHPFSTQIIKGIQAPLVSTSANISGEPTAKSWKEVNPKVLEQVDKAVDLQSDFSTTNQPSRIVKIIEDNVEVIRA